MKMFKGRRTHKNFLTREVGAYVRDCARSTSSAQLTQLLEFGRQSFYCLFRYQSINPSKSFTKRILNFIHCPLLTLTNDTKNNEGGNGMYAVAVLTDGMRRRNVEHQTGSSVQCKVGAGWTEIPLLLQSRPTECRDPGAHVAVRCRQRRRLAVPAAADRRLAVARAMSRMLVAGWLRRPLQGGIRQRQSSVTLTRPHMQLQS